MTIHGKDVDFVLTCIDQEVTSVIDSHRGDAEKIGKNVEKKNRKIIKKIMRKK